MQQDYRLASDEIEVKLQEHVGTMLEAARTILTIVIHLCEDKKMYGAFWVRLKASIVDNWLLMISNSSRSTTLSARLPLSMYPLCNDK